jgi:N-acetylmuramoyl-L-alanine amidase
LPFDSFSAAISAQSLARRGGALLAIAVLGLILCTGALARPQETAPVANGASKLALVTLPEMGNVQFVALGDLAERLDLRTFYSEKARKVILYSGSNEIKVTAMNPFVQVNQRMVQLPLETRFANGDILVPLRYFADLLRPLYPSRWPEELEFSPPPKANNAAPSATASTDPPGALTPVAPKPEAVPAIISKILVEEKANGTLIRVQAAPPIARKQVNTRVGQRLLHIDVAGGRLDSNFVRNIRPAGIVQHVTSQHTGAVVQISCQLKEDIDQKRISISGQGNETLISLPTLDQLSTSVLRNLETEKRKWLLDTIVLDAGHGGHDPGAIGPNGVREKDITLAIAKRVKRLLEKNIEARIVMTRDSDRYLSPRERTQLANAAQGKIFISIHCNSNLSRRVNGTTTYILGPARSEEALEVARRENAVIKYDPDSSSYAGEGDESFILAAMAQSAFNRESEDFAAMIQEEICAGIKLPDRGVKQAGFYVMVGASMPNILVETAFLSNPREEGLLSDAGFQQDIAEAIFNGIKRFKEKYESGI